MDGVTLLACGCCIGVVLTLIVIGAWILKTFSRM